MRFATIAAAALLAGCMTMGKPFRATQVPLIEAGKTSSADLRAMFGEPQRTGLDDGDATETWLHYKLRLFGAQDTKDLYVRYGKDMRVKSYSFNSTFPEDSEALRSKR